MSSYNLRNCHWEMLTFIYGQSGSNALFSMQTQPEGQSRPTAFWNVSSSPGRLVLFVSKDLQEYFRKTSSICLHVCDSACKYLPKLHCLYSFFFSGRKLALTILDRSPTTKLCIKIFTTQQSCCYSKYISVYTYTRETKLINMKQKKWSNFYSSDIFQRDGRWFFMLPGSKQ